MTYQVLFTTAYATIEQWFTDETEAYAAVADFTIKLGVPKSFLINKVGG